MSDNRTTNTVKTIFSGYLMQVSTVLLSFVNRSVFIYCLNADYLGLNGLFTSVLSVLSLSELGIGSAITFHLYKPISQNDTKHIRKLTEFYKKCYRVIGAVIIALGLLIMPFLKHMVNLESELPVNLYLIYILYLFNTAASYLFFAYFQTIVIAHQKQYLIDKYKILFKILTSVCCCVLLLITKNYYSYLITQITLTFIQNWYIRKKTLTIFPFLNNTKGEKIDKKEVMKIKKDVFSIMITRISSTLSSSFDSMIISTFINTAMVGLVSNYLLIISNVITISNRLIISATAAVGNLITQQDDTRTYRVFKELDFFNYFIMYFITVCLCVLSDPFIKIWIGSEYTLATNIVYLLIFSYYIRYSLNVVWMFKDGMGMFKQGRWVQLIQGISNLLLSIILCRNYGVAGIYAATFVTQALITWPLYNYYIYKIGFGQSFIKRVGELFIRTGVIIAVVYIINTIGQRFNNESIWDFVSMLIICVIFSVVVFLILFGNTKEFKSLFNRAKQLISKKGKC